MSSAEEQRIGKEMDADIRKSKKVSTNSAVNSYVSSIGAKLASGKPFRFTVLDDPKTVNAFAIPGGYIYITTGMLKKLDSESELAAVLGHEIGHITENHIRARVRNFTVARAFVGVLGKLTKKDLHETHAVKIGNYLLMQKFSRKHEYAADIAGVRNMVNAGYNPNGMVSLQDKLYSLSKGRLNLEFLNSHPSSKKRRDEVAQYIVENNLVKPNQIINTSKFKSLVSK